MFLTPSNLEKHCKIKMLNIEFLKGIGGIYSLSYSAKFTSRSGIQGLCLGSI